MRVLVFGGGAREHALVARLAEDPDPPEIIAAPGNPGIAGIARTVPANLSDPDDLLRVADAERVDFTIVGPEGPLSEINPFGISYAEEVVGIRQVCGDG